MRFAVTRRPRPAHAAPTEAATDRSTSAGERLPARTRRRKGRAPLIIFTAYALVIGVNEWRLRSQVVAADHVDQPLVFEELTVVEP